MSKKIEILKLIFCKNGDQNSEKAVAQDFILSDPRSWQLLDGSHTAKQKLGQMPSIRFLRGSSTEIKYVSFTSGDDPIVATDFETGPISSLAGIGRDDQRSTRSENVQSGKFVLPEFCQYWCHICSGRSYVLHA